MLDEADYFNKPGPDWYPWWAWHPVVVKRSAIPVRWLITVWRRDLDGKNFECVPAPPRPETEEERADRQW